MRPTRTFKCAKSNSPAVPTCGPSACACLLPACACSRGLRSVWLEAGAAGALACLELMWLPCLASLRPLGFPASGRDASVRPAHRPPSSVPVAGNASLCWSSTGRIQRWNAVPHSGSRLVRGLTVNPGRRRGEGCNKAPALGEQRPTNRGGVAWEASMAVRPETGPPSLPSHAFTPEGLFGGHLVPGLQRSAELAPPPTPGPFWDEMTLQL